MTGRIPRTRHRFISLNRTRGEFAFGIFNTVFLCILSLIFIMPVWHVIMSSFSDPDIVQGTSTLALLPKGQATLGGYRLVFKNPNIWRSYLNTLLYEPSFTAVGLLLCILSAYVLSRKELGSRKWLTFVFTFTMIFNGGLVPTFIVVNRLRLTDTPWAMIIPGSFSVYYMIIMRTSFMSIPDSLVESAKIDGAGHMRILFQIVLPVSKAVVASIFMFLVIRCWNGWFNASIYLQKRRDLYPLQLYLREIILQTSDTLDSTLVAEASDISDMDKFRPITKYCTITFSILPMLILYPFVQKYFVKGVMIGSIKG